MFVNIQIDSKNQNSLKGYLKLLFKICIFQKLEIKTILKSFNQKSQHRIFTILQSPHVNKISQEQLEYNLKSNQLNAGSLQSLKLLFIIKKIQSVRCFDISVKIRYVINRTSNKNSLFKNLLPYNYKIKNYHEKILTAKYCKLIELYGFLILLPLSK